MIDPWTDIYNQKRAEGYSDQRAYDIASEEMAKRRAAFDPNTIVGLPEQEANDLMRTNGYIMRVVKRDIGGVGSIHLDNRINRRNVEIKEGKVLKIAYVG